MRLFFSFFFCLTFTFQLLDKLWSQVSSLLPPGTCLQFLLSRIGFSIPTARRLSSNVAHSRFRAFRESQFVHKKKSPQKFTRVCTRGDSNSRNWPIAGTRITCYSGGATGLQRKNTTRYNRLWTVLTSCTVHGLYIVPVFKVVTTVVVVLKNLGASWKKSVATIDQV